MSARYLYWIIFHITWGFLWMIFLYHALVYRCRVGQRRKSRSACVIANAHVKNPKKPVNDRSGSFYLPAGIARITRRCAMHDEKYEGSPTADARHRHRRRRLLFRNGEECSACTVRHESTILAWRLISLGETRFKKSRGNVRRLNLKYFERYVSLRRLTMKFLPPEKFISGSTITEFCVSNWSNDSRYILYHCNMYKTWMKKNIISLL